MIIAIDVGNTNIVIGVYKEKRLVDFMRFSTERSRTADEYGVFFKHFLSKLNMAEEDIEGVIIGTVVPSVMFSLEHAVKKYIGREAIIVSAALDTGLELKIDNPNELGADAIANAVAASNKYKGNVIVVDFGTATTFSAISEEKEFLGGAICTGIRVSLEALSVAAAKLPWIEFATPARAIGTNTIECMQAGNVFGYAGQVDGIVSRMKRELPGRVKVVATGGLSSIVTPHTDTIDLIDKGLTLEGLRILYERNAE